MNYVLQNIVALAVLLFSVIFAIYFFFSRQQYQYIPDSIGKIGCIHPVYIKGDVLEPTLTKGTYIFLNQCIKEDEIVPVNSIVYFEYEGERKLGIVTGIKNKGYTIDVGNESSTDVESTYILGYTPVE